MKHLPFEYLDVTATVNHFARVALNRVRYHLEYYKKKPIVNNKRELLSDKRHSRDAVDKLVQIAPQVLVADSKGI